MKEQLEKLRREQAKDIKRHEVTNSILTKKYTRAASQFEATYKI